MMRYKRWIGGDLLVPLILFFIMSVGTANAQSSANYRMAKDVLDAAGAPSISTNYKLEDAAGQPSAIGNSSSTGYMLSAGYLGAFEEVAQTQHFSFTANTGDSYSIVVSGATLDGNSLAAGDEIGVFTPGDLCVGASVWDGNTPLALVAWIDDSQTQGVVDGYAVGETMSFKIWQQSSDIEFSATPTYTQGNGLFGSGAFAQLTLTAGSGGEPSGLFVTNTNDAGSGSLREAIALSNNNAGPDTIRFAIPNTDPGFDATAGVWTIQPLSALPAISDSGLVLDGSSQAEFIGDDGNPVGPEIVINGELAGNSVNGLMINSSNNLISHLVVNGFSNFGILMNLEAAHHNTVIGCYVGTNASGTASVPNNIGVYVWQATHNIIGGTESTMSNLVSGNNADGITLGGENASHNLVVGNYIGTVAGGDAALANGGMGLSVSGSDNRVGGELASERNIISGNGHDGIRIGGSRNLILGNYIGTDATGTSAIGNGWDGISLGAGEENIVGGLQPGEGNLVCGNQVRDILIMSNRNQVIGNYIGTDSSGTIDMGNHSAGISMNFGAKQNIVGPSNSIAFNQFSGIYIATDSSRQNTITQNSITSNLGEGILIRDGGNANISPPAGITVIAGLMSGTAPPQSTIEIFSDSDNEGKIYEGTTTADASGNFQWNGTPTGPNVTATATDADGNTSQFSQPTNVTSVAETAELIIPEEFSLSQNYPNPFNPVTKIQFALPSRSKVTLAVYNLLGETLLTLIDKEMPAGIHTLSFDGDQLSSGVYFYRLQATNAQNATTFTRTRKLTLLK